MDPVNSTFLFHSKSNAPKAVDPLVPWMFRKKVAKVAEVIVNAPPVEQRIDPLEIASSAVVLERVCEEIPKEIFSENVATLALEEALPISREIFPIKPEVALEKLPPNFCRKMYSHVNARSLSYFALMVLAIAFVAYLWYSWKGAKRAVPKEPVLPIQEKPVVLVEEPKVVVDEEVQTAPLIIEKPIAAGVSKVAMAACFLATGLFGYLFGRAQGKGTANCRTAAQTEPLAHIGRAQGRGVANCHTAAQTEPFVHMHRDSQVSANELDRIDSLSSIQGSSPTAPYCETVSSQDNTSGAHLRTGTPFPPPRRLPDSTVNFALGTPRRRAQSLNMGSTQRTLFDSPRPFTRSQTSLSGLLSGRRESSSLESSPNVTFYRTPRADSRYLLHHEQSKEIPEYSRILNTDVKVKEFLRNSPASTYGFIEHAGNMYVRTNKLGKFDVDLLERGIKRSIERGSPNTSGHS